MDLMLSREIVQKAIIDFKPKAIVMMFSGGDDSLTAYHVAKELSVKIDYVIHGNTRTGIQETTKFSIREVDRIGDKLLIADAGEAYVNYVMRKGFFGLGETAHQYSYHVLKAEHFRKTVSKHIRQRRRNFPILFLNGARRLESKRRERTMKNPIRVDGNDIWVNIINEFKKIDCRNYLEGNSIIRNPVSVNLCRSGECMCGTMQGKGDRFEAGYFYPDWKKWIDDLEKKVKEKFPWGWGENISKQHLLEMKGQINMFSDFRPMCVGCEKIYEEQIENEK